MQKRVTLDSYKKISNTHFPGLQRCFRGRSWRIRLGRCITSLGPNSQNIRWKTRRLWSSTTRWSAQRGSLLHNESIGSLGYPMHLVFKEGIDLKSKPWGRASCPILISIFILLKLEDFHLPLALVCHASTVSLVASA